jgi:hypothetical protein
MSATLRHELAAERQDIEQVDAELRRVGEAADGLVRAAQELRGALDSLSESVRGVVREAAVQPAVAAAPEPVPDAPSDVPEGARIVALDMVLDGKPREEVATHLREEFGLADSDGLLDEVYARVG